MPIYWGDYLRDTRDLTTLQHGAYLLLIAHYWQHDGLPSEEARLAAIAGVTPQVWKTIRGAIADKFQEGWKHKRVDDEIQKAERKWMQRSQAGKAGGQRSGIARSIKQGSELKAVGNRERSERFAERLSGDEAKSNLSRTNHQVSTTSSFSEASQSGGGGRDGLLATALPDGRARSPSKTLQASDSLKRSLAAKGLIPDDGLAIPEKFRRTQ